MNEFSKWCIFSLAYTSMKKRLRIKNGETKMR